MSLFGKNLENLRQLYLDELKDLYDAEHQILEALPKMEERAHTNELKDGFARHFEQTQRQIARLEQVFQSLGERAERKTCKGMKGLIAEGDSFVSASGDDETVDAALIGAAQRVEHYEMAAYGTLRTWARILGEEKQAKLLQQTLDEEGETDKKLTGIAESWVNVQAAVGRV
jgi:ferritin-like metal-binding protein YciE